MSADPCAPGGRCPICNPRPPKCDQCEQPLEPESESDLCPPCQAAAAEQRAVAAWDCLSRGQFHELARLLAPTREET